MCLEYIKQHLAKCSGHMMFSHYVDMNFLLEGWKQQQTWSGFTVAVPLDHIKTIHLSTSK